MAAPLAACPCCGLVQHLPPIGPGLRLACARCSTRLPRRDRQSLSSGRTAALALAALALYPLAISLPIMRVERLGVLREASVWSGGVALMTDGQVLVGLVVLVASVVLPLFKLAGLFVLSGGALIRRPRLAAATWHLVEWTGRWGMLDVLLVAVLVAVVKLGQLMELSAGPGALAFTACVFLNLLASASFDPHSLWAEESS